MQYKSKSDSEIFVKDLCICNEITCLGGGNENFSFILLLIGFLNIDISPECQCQNISDSFKQ